MLAIQMSQHHPQKKRITLKAEKDQLALNLGHCKSLPLPGIEIVTVQRLERWLLYMLRKENKEKMPIKIYSGKNLLRSLGPLETTGGVLHREE